MPYQRRVEGITPMHRRIPKFAPLAALLLCLPTMPCAQSPEWKAIACTIDSPDSLRGLIMPIYFAENGNINYDGIQSSGAVTSTQIRFCYATTNNQGCLTISRLSGRFNLTVPFGYARGSCEAVSNPKLPPDVAPSK